MSEWVVAVLPREQLIVVFSRTQEPMTSQSHVECVHGACCVEDQSAVSCSIAKEMGRDPTAASA